MKTIIKLLTLPFVLLSYIFGRINWLAPPWLIAGNSFRQNRPKLFWGGLVVLTMIGAGYVYYRSLPSPITIEAVINAPDITADSEQATPDSLNIQFNYDLSDLKVDQVAPEGLPSVARIDLVGEEITQGIQLTPAKEGRWLWVDDRRIRFEPKSDWAAGTQYQVTFSPGIFVEEALLSDTQYQFSTPQFEADISNMRFYQDPQDISVRRTVATVRFSHPVDKSTFESQLSMTMRPSSSELSTEPKAYPFQISYSKSLREAYIQSEPVSLPSEPNYMKLSLDKGVKSLLGGAPSEDSDEQKILIPDIYSFLKVSNLQTQIIRNEKNEPQQVFMLEFTDEIEKEEITDKLSVYLLPKRGEPAGKNHWKGPRLVSEKVLKYSTKVDLEFIENERSASKNYNVVVDVPESRQLYIKIAPGLKSVNRFVHASFYDQVLRLPAYPKEVDIAGEGALLTYSGEHKLSIVSRGVPALKYRVGRLLDGQINHLVSQTRGDISHSDFSSWSFNESNLSEFGEFIVDIVSDHPQKANFSSLDLTRLLPKTKDRFGLFFIEVYGWDRSKNRRIYGADDKRLVMVTDLGVIVKNNADRSHHVFVQSVKTGLPVTGAKVELLGKNGVALFSKTTTSEGHVALPSTQDFQDEKEPTVYVVKTADDISFIPYDRYSRQINLSRFDIGGVDNRYQNQDSLNAYLFSDRGIYRPGESVNLGAIVKNFDFSNVDNIPLEMVVRGPRNNQVQVKKLMLAELGFFDYQFETEATSDTGQYRAALHLVRDNRYRGREIGSVGFKVEEFQPDTMKIESRLLDVTDKGWSDKESIVARVSLQNLFGIPAQERNVTGRMVIRPSNFSFKEFADYQFTDPHFDPKQKALSVDKKLTAQKTDADGMVSFELDLQNFKQGTYNLRFTAEGFEQGGGRSVVSSSSTLISPLSQLVGYKTDGKLDYINVDSQREIEFVAIDKLLNQINSSGLSFRKKQIQQVSTLVRQYDGTYQYQSITKEKELAQNVFEIPEAGYRYTLDTSEPGDYAIEILDNQNRRLARVEYSVVGHGNLTAKLDKNAELQLKLDKADYFPGETIQMNIKAPYKGAGLITIETDRVHHFKWFKTDSESSIQSITIPDYLEGTGYVNVSFIRDFGSKEIFTSPLSYAVKPFSIDKSQRNINVSLKVDEIVRPGKAMKIHYSADKPSKAIVFAVDEGILQVANYATPNPLNHFLKKRALTVDTLQILDLILPEFELLKSLSSSGGGAMASRALAKNLNPFSRKTDRPAVFWSGVVDANSETKSVNFDVPDTFAGRLRVMAVAVADSAVGVGQKSTIVRGPFVLSPNVLTQASPGDEFTVTLGVANIIEGSGKNAAIDITVEASPHLKILSDSKASLNIDEGGEGKVSFKVKAQAMLGAAEIKFTARFKYEISTRTASLSIRPAMPFYSSFESGFSDSGSVTLGVNRKLFGNLAKQSVAASASPLVLVDGLTSYLETFPHGCTEQVVSKVFPLVGLMSHPAYAPHVKNVDEHFAHIISKLRGRQLADGGFAFWPGQHVTADYPSIYVMHFLIESQSLGYRVPNDMIRRGRDFLEQYAMRSTTSMAQARNRANAIYLLSRLGLVTTNYLVDLEEYLNKNHGKAWRKDLTAVYMASTYQLLQKDDEANRLVAQYELGAEKISGLKNNVMDDFHSVLTRDAQFIYLLARHFESKARALSGDDIIKLTSRIFKGEYNTIASAYSVLALGAYSKLVLSDLEKNEGSANEKNLKFYAKIKDAQQKQLEIMRAPFAKASYKVDTDSVSLESDSSLYYLNVQSGFNIDLPQKAMRQGIEVQRDFLDASGNKVTQFTQGEELTVRLRIRALENRKLTNIAVIDLLPGGFEVIRSSVSRTAYNWKADYIDVREDRVVFYGDFDSRARDLTYKVKLTAAGDFVIPPSYAESMYDRSIRAVSVAGKFVVAPKNR